MKLTSEPLSLYRRDFVAWCEETLSQLKAQNFHELDLASLIEEIEGLANRERKELRSRLDVLLQHLLKRLYVRNSYDDRGWENTIAEQRRQLQILLEASPSLSRFLTEVFEDSWQYALKRVRKDYPNVEFPETWQFSREPEILLNEELWKTEENQGCDQESLS